MDGSLGGPDTEKLVSLTLTDEALVTTLFPNIILYLICFFMIGLC